MIQKILFLGDVVGAPGRDAISRVLPRLITRWGIDLVVCNAENSAGGSGLTPACYEQMREAGVDAFTLGDHAFRRGEIFELLENSGRMCRPANYPTDAPGPEFVVVPTRQGVPVGVFTVLGRTFMKPIDCPMRASDRVLDALRPATKVVLVDIHAEATSDKQVLGRYLDGRVAAVLGTHTHVPTADEQIFPGGTAYQTDVGMTGPYDSILGRRTERVVEATYTHLYQRFDVARDDPRLCGALVTVNCDLGTAVEIRRVMVRPDDPI
jgi:metallophosphoesterase (TIGR00282 family)